MHGMRRGVLLVQLPIPPLGPQPIRGNVPLAAGYLKLFARKRGLEAFYDVSIFPPGLANTLSDQALVHAIVARQPWLVGFTCYLWNVDRTLWIAKRVKEALPGVRIVVGGPEITIDNAWVLDSDAIDHAVVGEGEQTFADLLLALIDEDVPPIAIPGLVGKAQHAFVPRKPLPYLDVISSPYLDGILDAADERMLLLETIRGCVFKCKFCYYPKSYDALYFVSEERIVANLRHAAERGATEVVLLDPTLNQRKNFHEFLRLLARCNPGKRFTYFGELRGEGITETTAQLLKEANFTDVEIGLQSVDPRAQELMDRKNNLRAFERGARAVLNQGIKVKVDLIIGLPGDTVDSIRHGMEYLRTSGLYTDVQVFNLSVLPGTAFRQEAKELGLRFQSRPPYYVLETPTLRREDMFMLMEEAQEVFGMEWDPLPPPELPSSCREPSGTEENGRCREPSGTGTVQVPGVGTGQVRLGSPDLRHDFCFIDLDHAIPPTIDQHNQCFTLWLRATNFDHHVAAMQTFAEKLLATNPFMTLQIVLEPVADPSSITPKLLRTLLAACHRHPSYLDRFYALQPGKPIGAKRIVVAVRREERVSEAWRDGIETMAWVVVLETRTPSVPRSVW